MKIAVNVTRAEQVMDLDAGTQQTFLVVQLATGLEIKVPCTEGQLAEVVATSRRQSQNTLGRSPSENPNTGIPERVYTYNGGQESTEDGTPLPLSQQETIGAPANPDEAVIYTGPFQSAAEPVQQVAVPKVVNPMSSASPVSRLRQPMADDAGIGQG